MSTMRITMLQTRMGPGGALMTAAGSPYTVDMGLGTELIGSGYATDTDGVISPPLIGGKTPVQYDPATRSAVSPDGNAVGGVPIQPIAGIPVDLPDGALHIVSASPLDMSARRLTAVPAGARGRLVIHGTDATKIAEASAPNTGIRLHVATWAPDATYVPLPMSKAAITAGVEHLARSGYNALRFHGVEYWLMAGTSTAFEFPADRIDALDWMFAECKRLGLYWVINPRQPELYQAGANRFTMPGGARNFKPRLFVQQDARDHWQQGFALLYNRVNPYTGVHILQDPALFQVECMNECGASFVASSAWPDTWITRDGGSVRGGAGLTWNEWLADPAQAHGYANIAALNSAQGTAYANFAAVPAPTGNLPNAAMPNTVLSIDVQKYLSYLDDSLADYFDSALTAMGYTGLRSAQIAFPAMLALRNIARKSGNSIVNWHEYTFITQGDQPGATISAANLPLWSYSSWYQQPGMYGGGKPVYAGEFGWPWWGKYRNQFPMLHAYSAFHGTAGVSNFHQGNFFSPRYEVSADARTRQLYAYSGHSDPVVQFGQLLGFFAFHCGDVAEGAAAKTLTFSDAYSGMNPVVGGRAGRGVLKMYVPTALIPSAAKTRLTYSTDTGDVALAATYADDWYTQLAALQVGGFIGPTNAALVSATINRGSIASVTTSGAVGTVTASATQPVLELTGNTLADGDQIAVTNIAGSGGTWPGTNNRGSRATVIQTGVAGKVQVISGLNLTGLTGFTSGTWCELDNVVQSGSGELFVSRRAKVAVINTPKLKAFFDGGANSGIYPYSSGGLSNLVVESCTAGAAVFMRSMDGASLIASGDILVGIVGATYNAGEVLTVSDTTLTAVGEYPIYQDSVEALLTLTRSTFGRFVLDALDMSGRVVSTTPVQISGTAMKVRLSVLGTGRNFFRLRKVS